MKRLDNRLVLLLTLRLYSVRLFYNYTNLFGTGMLSSINSFIKYLNPEAGTSGVIKRHMSFFNTNEYLSGFAAGIILNLEMNSDKLRIEKTKTVISSTLGAVGDYLVYSLILPIMILVALNKFAVSGFRFTECAAAVVISEIILFNFLSFFLKFYGIKSGYSSGVDSLKLFKSPSYKNIVKFLKYVKIFLIIVLVFNLLFFVSVVSDSTSMLLAFFLVSVLIILIFRKFRPVNVTPGIVFFIFLAIFVTFSCFF